MAPFVIRACPGSTWATPGADRRRDKNENFFWSTPNDPIRKVNRLKSIFEHLSKILSTTGWSQPSLRNFSRKKWKHDHQKLGQSSSLYSLTNMKGWCFYHRTCKLRGSRLWFFAFHKYIEASCFKHAVSREISMSSQTQVEAHTYTHKYTFTQIHSLTHTHTHADTHAH